MATSSLDPARRAVFIAKKGGRIFEVCDAFETACVHLRREFGRGSHVKFEQTATSLYASRMGKVVGTVLPYYVTPAPVGAPPGESKIDVAIRLVCRPEGATHAECQAYVGWKSVNWGKLQDRVTIVRAEKMPGGTTRFWGERVAAPVEGL
jgi:hypothetical protein